MKWGYLIGEAVSRLPIEKLFSRAAPSNREKLEELRDILGTSDRPVNTDAEASQTSPESHPRVHLEPKRSDVSTEETVAYENREMVKAMRALAKHCTQRFRIFGKPCDCGQTRHLLELESLAEETVSMVDNPDVYYRIIEVGKELEPKVTLEAIGSGRYDDDYPRYAKIYRDLCKELGFHETVDRDLLTKPEPGQYFEEVEANDSA